MNKNLTNREILIMKCIWNKKGDLTLPEIISMLEDRYQWTASRSTVRTFLTDMEKKGYVKFERRGKFAYIVPLIEEDLYKEEQAENMVDLWFDGSKKSFFKTLAKNITKEEADYLSRVLDELNDEE